MTRTAERSTSLTPTQLIELRARLVDDKDATTRLVAQLGADLASISQSRQDTSTDDEHDPEGPTLAFERSQSSAILTQTCARITEIDRALERMDDGSYGICAACGQAIPAARLDARPYSVQCVGCASRTRA
jgi:RNA polymerase-binding transcription factor DksA